VISSLFSGTATYADDESNAFNVLMVPISHSLLPKTIFTLGHRVKLRAFQGGPSFRTKCILISYYTPYKDSKSQFIGFGVQNMKSK